MRCEKNNDTNTKRYDKAKITCRIERWPCKTTPKIKFINSIALIHIMFKENF